MTTGSARPQRKSIRAVLTIGISLALGWATVGASDVRPTRGDLTSTFARSSAPAKPSAPVPDFDGDGSSEVLWYGAGDAKDEIWQWNGRQFDTKPLSVSGTYFQVLLDVDGDGDTDVFWYAPGDKPDFLWRSTGTGFVDSTHQVRGSYLPVVVDRNGDGADEIFWYAGGPARDYLWSWDGDGAFESEPQRVLGWYEPLVGDLDGSGAENIFWYAAGSKPDFLWSWDRTGAKSQRFAVNGAYQPFTADADGDRDDEIIWYAPGSRKDFRWDLSSGSVSSEAVRIKGVYEPYVGDFDADGRDEVVLYADGSAADYLWHIDTGESVRLPEAGTGLAPRVGDFDGDAAADLLLPRSDDVDDAVWWRGGPDGFDRIATAAQRPPTVKPSPTTTTASPTTTTTASPTTTTTATQGSTTPAEQTGWKYPKPSAGSTINLSNKAGERVALRLEAYEDVTIVLPGGPLESLSVSGGRNITIDGGTVVQRVHHSAAVQFKNFSGELHIRDLHVDTGGPAIEGDAFRINSEHPGSIATLQRVRVTNVYGTFKNPDGTNAPHGDIIQTWAGPSVMRIWKFTGYGDYQGFFFAPGHFDHAPHGQWEFEDVDLHGLPTGGNHLWAMSDQGSGFGGTLVIKNSWADHSLGDWKPHYDDTFYAAGVKEGSPPGGEFVRARS